MFRVGQKVVCVETATDDQQKAWSAYAAVFPVVGAIYRIRSIAFDNPEQPKGLVTLAEIDNSHIQCMMHYPSEPAFPVRAFRPIVEHKTSIEIFTKMLTPADAKVPA